MEPLVSFDDISSAAVTANAEDIGNKAYRLLQLRRLGFAVPESWVIPSYEFSVHMGQPSVAESIKACDPAGNRDSWQAASQAIIEAPLRNHLVDALSTAGRAWFANSEPRPLTVRSSANTEDTLSHSFAGIFSSVLNLRSLCEVLDAITHCWASVWSERAIAYCRRARIEHSVIRMALLIQHVIPARVAGVLFTCDPVSMDSDTVVIEAANCAGEEVVSGQVSPVCYKLGMLDGLGTMRSPDSGNAVVLSDAQCSWLLSISHVVRHHFDRHQEIEWVFDFQGKGYVLQTRPITTKKRSSQARSENSECHN